MQILPDQMAVPGSFQNSFNTGLQNLLNIKLNQMQQKHQMRQWAEGYKASGLPESWAALHPNVQKAMVTQHFMNQMINPESNLNQALSGQSPQQGQQSMVQNQYASPNADVSNQNVVPFASKTPIFDPLKIGSSQLIPNKEIDKINKVMAFNPILGMKLEASRKSRQDAIDSKNKKFIDEMTLEKSKSEKALSTISKLRDLLNTGKVYSSLKGQYVPQALRNAESQAFESGATDLITSMAKGTGQISAAKLRIYGRVKPMLSDKTEAQYDILARNERSEAFGQKASKIYDDIINENGGYAPADLQQQFNKRLDALEKYEKIREARIKKISQKKDFKDITDAPAEAFTGKSAYDDNGNEYISDGHQWVKIGG